MHIIKVWTLLNAHKKNVHCTFIYIFEFEVKTTSRIFILNCQGSYPNTIVILYINKKKMSINIKNKLEIISRLEILMKILSLYSYSFIKYKVKQNRFNWILVLHKILLLQVPNTFNFFY